VVGVNVSRLRGELAQFENMGFAISADEIYFISDVLQTGEVRLMPTLTPTPSPTPTLAPAPILTSASISEWCVFRAKYAEFRKVENEYFTRWNERTTQGHVPFDEMQTWANEYSLIMDLACSLPRSPVAARPIADKLCASADSWLIWFQNGGGPQWDYLRVQGNQNGTEAVDMVIDLNTQYGNPSCQSLVPAPTAIPATVGEWCIFRSKYLEYDKENEAFVARWNERNKQGPLSSDEWQALANEYIDIMELACALPRSPLAVRPIADKLCASADFEVSYLRGEGSSDDLRVQSNQGRTDAYDMVTDLDMQFGNPSCE
jgi:hypothetical protein